MSVPSLTFDNQWRAIILFGQNTASYKFALAKSLLELSQEGQSLITLDELAVPYAHHLTEHLRRGSKQSTSTSSRYLNECTRYIQGETDQSALQAATVKLGFQNVLDAFHVVNRKELPVRFFLDERKGPSKGIRLTDEIYQLQELFQVENLPDEVEARWSLVETAWELNINRRLIAVQYDEAGQLLFTEDTLRRRVNITSCRNSLNGYQQGKCFYCYSDISLLEGSEHLADVDHFLPHTLTQVWQEANLNGIWNLVLACKSCNRGIGGKSAWVPKERFLERLDKRNEHLIGSHHPLRETLILQTGSTPEERRGFLKTRYQEALSVLIHQWEPAFEHEATF